MNRKVVVLVLLALITAACGGRAAAVGSPAADAPPTPVPMATPRPARTARPPTPAGRQVAQATPETEAGGEAEADSGGVRIEGVFIVFHMEVSRPPRIKTLWPLLGQLVSLADAYGHKLTLHVSAPWAEYLLASGGDQTLLAWEANGHEIGLHHHGTTHKFFDGYTNDPDSIRTDGWYSTEGTYKGDMAALMELLAPLSRQGIFSASMSDEDVDWPEGVLYYATDSGDEPSKEDLLSTPVATEHNGFPVIEVYNAGYAIDHLGDAAVSLDEVEQGLRQGEPGQVMGIVFNDETIEKHFDQVEPLFQMFADYGLQVETMRGLLGN